MLLWDKIAKQLYFINLYIFTKVLSTFSRLRFADFVKVAKNASTITLHVLNMYKLYCNTNISSQKMQPFWFFVARRKGTSLGRKRTGVRGKALQIIKNLEFYCSFSRSSQCGLRQKNQKVHFILEYVLNIK